MHNGFEVVRSTLQTVANDEVITEVRAELQAEHDRATLDAIELRPEDALWIRDNRVQDTGERIRKLVGLFHGLNGAALQRAIRYALRKHSIRHALGILAEDRPLTTADLEAFDDGRGPRRLDRYSNAVLGLAREDRESSGLALCAFERARVLAYRWLFDGFDLLGHRWTDADADTVLGRVRERATLLAYLGIVGAKWTRTKPPAIAYPMRELGEIFDRMGLETDRIRNRLKAPMGPRCPGFSCQLEGKEGPSGTQRARDVRKIVDGSTTYVVLPESAATTQGLALRRNAAAHRAETLRTIEPDQLLPTRRLAVEEHRRRYPLTPALPAAASEARPVHPHPTVVARTESGHARASQAGGQRRVNRGETLDRF